MDIFADGKTFMLGMGLGDYKYAAAKDGSLVLTAGKHNYPLNVTTNRGTFLEVVDKNGAVIQDGGDGSWLFLTLGKDPITLRYKTLATPKMDKRQIKKARKSTTVYVVRQQRYDTGPINFGASYENGSFLKVLNSFKAALANIPAKYRANACCQIDSEGGYEGSHYASVEITYNRPETDAEVLSRVKVEAEQNRLATENKKVQLKKLKSELEA